MIEVPRTLSTLLFLATLWESEMSECLLRHTHFSRESVVVVQRGLGFYVPLETVRAHNFTELLKIKLQVCYIGTARPFASLLRPL